MCVKQKLFYYQKNFFFDKWENIFSVVFELTRSKNGIEYLRKYPKTASNRKVSEAKVSLNAKKTLSPKSQVAN